MQWSDDCAALILVVSLLLFRFAEISSDAHHPLGWSSLSLASYFIKFQKPLPRIRIYELHIGIGNKRFNIKNTSRLLVCTLNMTFPLKSNRNSRTHKINSLDKNAVKLSVYTKDFSLLSSVISMNYLNLYIINRKVQKQDLHELLSMFESYLQHLSFSVILSLSCALSQDELASASSALVKMINSWGGYGNKTCRWKKNAKK